MKECWNKSEEGLKEKLDDMIVNSVVLCYDYKDLRNKK